MLTCYISFIFGKYKLNGVLKDFESYFQTALTHRFRTLIKLRILFLLKFGECFVFQNIIYIFVQTQLIMRIIARSKIIEYYTEHPDAETALEDWFQKVKKAEWTCFSDIKKMFNSVDSVGNQHYVFNIRGNNHRLIVVVKFTIKTVLIRFIGTHVEYDLIDAKNI